jgi:LysR family hydrogen peroxide-inducible transcriptional activator
MTFQQLEYIVALNRHRHFVKAAAECGITQPTLSLMIQKLESELNVTIFDRARFPVEPTAMGERLISQAEITLRELRKMKEMVVSESECLSGTLRLGVIPTLAPYLVPEFMKTFRKNQSQIQLSISEMRTASLIEALQKDRVDMFIAATPLDQEDFFEIPLYYEKFAAYFASGNPFRDITLTAQNLPHENLWILQEGHCFRSQIFNFCHDTVNFNQEYEAGSIETLIRIVDINGGYTVIPELHLPFLTEAQRANVREIDCPPAVREISIVIRKDFIREKLINAVADTIKSLMPENMLNERLKKFSIRL